ncbi:MAG TPA: glycosyltransferase family 4 protein [Candidatus Saccharimonadia bacterium]|nr:glycosyltransferase family 4 protein [Candidatus Saccharimonadia bacterium]
MRAEHIVQVSSYYPPHLGGQENAVHDLATQLARDHQVDVLTSTAGGGAAGTSLEDGVRVTRFGGVVFGHAPIMPWFPIGLFRAARAGSVVHLHIGQAFTPEMVWLVSKLRRFRYIAQLHIDFEPSGPAGLLLPLYKRLVLGRVLRSAAMVVTLNEQTLRMVRRTYGCKRARVMHNGIDEVYFTLERLPFAPQPPNILHLLFVGRLSKQKNVPVLLEALRKTKRSVHLDIVGDGEERAVIDGFIADYGLGNVTVHGRLKRQEVMRFYEACDALIMPSLYEAQPLVLFEAMAARIPIIGTDVIGVADHIQKVGIIVEPTATGLVRGIDEFYDRYSSLPEMVSRGFASAEGLRWNRTLKEYEDLYEEILGD